MTVSGNRAHRAVLLTSLLMLSACIPEGEHPQTTFEPVSEFGRLINGLFYNTFWWTIGIMLLVEILILVFIFRYRARPGAPIPKQIHGHTGLEIAWTIVPAIIVAFIAVPTVAGIFTTQAKASENALQVEVIGHQWWWEFRYPQLGVVTANELVLPVGREVQLKMWSADVIHSYWIPKIGGKRDVNPQPRTTKDERAKYNYIVFNVEKPGYYLGQCAEFCGASHAIMRTSALALNENDFSQWAASMNGQMPVVGVNPMEASHGETSATQIPANAPGTREGGALGQPRDTLTVGDTARTSTVAGPTAGTVRQGANTPGGQAGVMPPTTTPAQAGPPAPSGLAPTGAPAPGRAGYQAAGPIPPGSTQRSAMAPGQQTLEERGHQLITSKACVACHAIRGTTMKGQLGPNLSRFGMRRYLGAGAKPNTMENLVAWIRHPQSIKPGTLMPGAREGAAGMPATGLTEDEIQAIAAYLLSLK
jgi:cytochrome c oxidase subunit II